MNDRLRRTVALLLVGGGVLVVVGIVVMHREWPGWSYQADGLNGGSYTVDESSYEETGSTIGVVAGGVVASTGMLMAVVAAVAIGVRLAAPDRGAGQR